MGLPRWLSDKEPACQCLGRGFFPSQEDPLKTHSSTLAWRIPSTEEPDWLQSMGVIKSWTWLSAYACVCWWAPMACPGSKPIWQPLQFLVSISQYLPMAQVNPELCRDGNFGKFASSLATLTQIYQDLLLVGLACVYVYNYILSPSTPPSFETILNFQINTIAKACLSQTMKTC